MFARCRRPSNRHLQQCHKLNREGHPIFLSNPPPHPPGLALSQQDYHLRPRHPLHSRGISGRPGIEAPNWSRDGIVLLINTEGNLYRLPLQGSGEPKPEQIDLSPGSYLCNNDHDFVPRR